MTSVDHKTILDGLSEIITRQDWANLGRVVHPEAVWQYPQSGEIFRGLTNIRAQFENYPGLGTGSSTLHEIIGDGAFALTPAYTLIALEGSGSRGTGVIRVRYPDGSLWWVLNLYELRDGLIGNARSYFAPDFEAPDWRKPYREGELAPTVEP